VIFCCDDCDERLTCTGERAQDKSENKNLAHEIHQSFGSVIDAQHDQPMNVGYAFDEVRREVWDIMKTRLSEMANQFKNEMGTAIAKTKNETCRGLQSHVDFSTAERE
jgi:hypothetical protein